MGAGWGFVGGWMVIVADIVVNANQADIAGAYGFKLFGLNGASNSTLDVVILGVIFIIALTWICWRGIELSARTQQFLLGFEMTTLIVFAVVGLIKAYSGSPHHAHGMVSTHVQLGWFNPFAVGTGPLLDGLLLGVFLFWGWDSGVSVNEETEDPTSAPGKAALISTLVLIGIFLLVTVAAQAYAGTGYLGNANNANDIFAAGLSTGVLGPLHFLLIIAVLTSATAATQTTILPAARQALSMARRGAFPAKLGEISPKSQVPAFATILAGVLSVVWFVVIEIASSNVLGDCVSGLGFLVCFYYGFTGLACAIFYRRELTKSVKNFLTLGLLPIIGFLALMLVFVKGMIFYGHAANDVSKPLLGLGVPDWIGILGVVTGVILMLWRRAVAPAYFNEPRMVAGDPIEVVTPEAEFAVI
jgi:amino acid transporter